MKKRFTGEYTRNPKKEPIFEGDIVMHCWGGGAYGGERKNIYRYHKIKFRDLAFRLGDTYNIWSGKEVIKVDKIPEGVILDETETDRNGKVLPLCDFWKRVESHLLGAPKMR